MTERVITVVEQRRLTAIKEFKTRFELRADRRHIWLQRVCFWLLAKVGAFAEMEVVTFERHVIGERGENFMARLFRAQHSIVGSFDINPTELLLGCDEYSELMQEICTQPFSFEANYYGQVGGVPEVRGLKVKIVPWMKGMLLL